MHNQGPCGRRSAPLTWICQLQHRLLVVTSIHHQAQYRTHFAPMAIDKWALPLFVKIGLQPASTSIAACTDIECASCQNTILIGVAGTITIRTLLIPSVTWA
eukprot:674000-Pelagomonas_calceolata.AAC.1